MRHLPAPQTTNPPQQPLNITRNACSPAPCTPEHEQHELLLGSGPPYATTPTRAQAAVPLDHQMQSPHPHGLVAPLGPQGIDLSRTHKAEILSSLAGPDVLLRALLHWNAASAALRGVDVPIAIGPDLVQAFTPAIGFRDMTRWFRFMVSKQLTIPNTWRFCVSSFQVWKKT